MTQHFVKYALAGLAMTMSAALDARHNAAEASEPFIAEVKIFAGNFAPRGYALCDGQLLPIAQNTALFSILGTTYGGDGRTTLALPDLRGRVAIHPGAGPGLTPVSLGQRGGTETNFLTVANLPSHSHTINHGHAATANASSANGNLKSPTGNVWATAKQKSYTSAAPDVQMAPAAISVEDHNGNSGNTGSNSAVENRQPFLGLNYIIALQGVFPTRN